ncbi:putative selenium-dependent hydroxylase accessory protein YqeC [Desulfitobacterium dichloroeliminans LMG P-21439]|uniref:Putative selenium-dependent hydroxylase accessory protein YqeC n=1 Tax=Desulfitobacterium dichloroeliminans (strain LMG P-21439 / DCA1) TaxID=871963 RepID=L0FBS9_DESDL|nr:selenium cofactor biosynthesis protein YqeC [Desulfitobacterium dichloroeliminans]AGA70672.1 putative selenium-dependent hydroxylase accessory protein YqeC [Desulfitobacterium dichloroeliminans LMG P-21439]
MLRQKTVTLWEMTGYAEVIVFIGAGGKTTALQALAQEIYSQGRRVIGTTTTKVYPMSSSFWQSWEHPDAPPPQDTETPCFWYKRNGEENKWLGPRVQVVDQALNGQTKDSGVWLIEGDGARGRKLKCWNQHEPQIPLRSQVAILLISGGLWGGTLTEEEIHRSELCPELLGGLWTIENAADYILNSPAFYSEYQELSWIVLFNIFEDQKSAHSSIEGTGQALLKKLEGEMLNPRPSRTRPRHLRLAEGDVKKGSLTCCDLW